MICSPGPTYRIYSLRLIQWSMQSDRAASLYHAPCIPVIAYCFLHVGMCSGGAEQSDKDGDGLIAGRPDGLPLFSFSLEISTPLLLSCRLILEASYLFLKTTDEGGLPGDRLTASASTGRGYARRYQV